MVDWRSWINNYIISVIIEAVKEKPTMFQAAAGAQPLLSSLEESVVQQARKLGKPILLRWG